MPRKPRMYLPGVPNHIIQRGNNRLPCFFEESDYHFYLACLKDAVTKYKVSVHAYVLMTNHTHLLMTPNDETGISSVMQSLGRRYVQYVNLKYRRYGTLWESRHKASLIHAENYLLTCYRYIEMNPIRAQMVKHPGDYPWSSYHRNAYGKQDPLIQSHALYQQLDKDKTARLHSYRTLFSTDIGDENLCQIRRAINFCMPLGNDRFREEIEQSLGRKIGHDNRGRPARRKEKKDKVT